jgi:hypothetical protein
LIIQFSVFRPEGPALPLTQALKPSSLYRSTEMLALREAEGQLRHPKAEF